MMIDICKQFRCCSRVWSNTQIFFNQSYNLISSLAHHLACWAVRSFCGPSRMHPNSSTRSTVSLLFSRRYIRASEIPALAFLDQQEKPKISSAQSRPSQTTMLFTKCLADELSGQSIPVLSCSMVAALLLSQNGTLAIDTLPNDLIFHIIRP